MEELSVYAKKTVKLLNDATITAHLSHWNVRSHNYYESHLLFDRIYEALDRMMDGLIERLRACGYNPDFAEFSGPGISMSNYECVALLNLNLDYVMSINSMVSLFFRYANAKDTPEMIGIADYLQSMANELLQVQGLLQQALGH